VFLRLQAILAWQITLLPPELESGRSSCRSSAVHTGTRCLDLLRRYWEHQECVARQGDYHGPAFKLSRGVTQGGIFSSTLFNILVDAVLRHWLEVCANEPDEQARAGIEARVVELLMHFLAYVDDTSLGSQDPVWLQNSLQFLTECFARVGLSTNIDKTEAMVCIPRSLRTHHSSAGYRRRLAGHGDNYRQRKRRRTTCPECGKGLADGSLASHLRTQHGTEIHGNTGAAYVV
jgi:Reverse transcriptase (RNA-dependent DNA polymerase)